MNSETEMKRTIIVEFGARRQRFTLASSELSISNLFHLIGRSFGTTLDCNSNYVLQIFNKTLNQYEPLKNDIQTYELLQHVEDLHRFRIVNKSADSQKSSLLNTLQSTLRKLHHATRNVIQLQDLVDNVNEDWKSLNQLMNVRCLNSYPSATVYLLDPSTVAVGENNDNVTKETSNIDLDDENFESVSCFDYDSNPNKCLPTQIPTIMHSTKQHLFTIDGDPIQTRIIPCKYAVRGICHLGDRCSYSHDEKSVQWAREWERRL